MGDIDSTQEWLASWAAGAANEPVRALLAGWIAAAANGWAAIPEDISTKV